MLHRDPIMRSAARSACLATCLLVASAWAALPVLADPVRNGFDLSRSAIPTAEILGGGPPRDGIPALDQPKVVSAAKAP